MDGEREVSVCDRGCRSRARAALAGWVRRVSFAACGGCGDDWADARVLEW